MQHNININILKKAFPHLDERRRKPINIILKLTELHECLNEVSSGSGLESCSDNVPPVNTEALLKDIKSECPKHIRDKIDMILNLSKTKEFYKTYMNLNNITNQPNQTLSNNNVPFEQLKNSLSPDQLERINELSNILNQQSPNETSEIVNY